MGKDRSPRAPRVLMGELHQPLSSQERGGESAGPLLQQDGALKAADLTPLRALPLSTFRPSLVRVPRGFPHPAHSAKSSGTLSPFSLRFFHQLPPGKSQS